jgi:hypothetical protein
MVKQTKKRGSRKMRCKNGGARAVSLRSKLKSGLTSITRRNPTLSKKGCKVKSKYKERIKNDINLLLEQYKSNKINVNALIVDINNVKEVYLKYCEGLDQLDKLKLTNKKKDNEKILKNTIKWIESLITPLSYIQATTERERSERRSKKGKSRRTSVKYPSPLGPNTGTASASTRSTSRSSASAVAQSVMSERRLTQRLLNKLPDNSPKRETTNSLSHRNTGSGPTLEVPENPKNHLSEKRPPGRATQTPNRLTLSALKAHNSKYQSEA